MVEMRRINRTWLFFDEECCEKYCLFFLPENEGCEGLTQIYCVQVRYKPKASEIGCLGVFLKVLKSPISAFLNTQKVSYLLAKNQI